jgi:predicted enzyme related to lactoylglutathione lyase
MSENGCCVPEAETFCWNELATPDPSAAGTFYAALLGWTIQEVPTVGPLGPMTYTLFKKGSRPVAGMLKMEGPMWQGIPPHWMGYIEVADVDISIAKAVELGGKVCVPPTDIPDVGRFAVLTDPVGATVALMTTKPHPSKGEAPKNQ